MDFDDDDYEYDPEEHAAAHIEWLKTVSPDDWHRTVLGFQWAEYYDPLFWIVQQEDCDRATALQIFWAMSPGIEDAASARAGRSDNYLNDNVITEYIANRLHGEGYKRAQIAFDAEPIMLGDYDLFKEELRDIEDPLWCPHPDMIRSISGREVTLDEGFNERCPDRFYSGGFEVGSSSAAPAFEVTTPGSERARAETDTILFNLIGMGVAIGVLLFADWSSARSLVLGGLAVLGGLWAAKQAGSSAAIVRSLIRAEYKSPSKGWAAAIASAGVLVGIAAAFVFLKFPVMGGVASLSGIGLTLAKALVAFSLLALFWFVARRASAYLIYGKEEG